MFHHPLGGKEGGLEVPIFSGGDGSATSDEAVQLNANMGVCSSLETVDQTIARQLPLYGRKVRRSNSNWGLVC